MSHEPSDPVPSARDVDAAELPLRGRPLHTRTLVIDLRREDAATVRAHGEILDLRKCDFVPTGADLQTAGFIHQMTIDLSLRREDRVITRLETEQPHIAYHPDPVTTGGESCRDPAPRLQGLVGSAVDEDFARQVSRVFGGPLGCSHLLTLAQLMGGTMRAGLDEEHERGHFGERRDGERIMKRTLVLDGTSASPGHLELGIQQSDFRLRPHAEVEGFLDRLEELREVRIHARVAAPLMSFEALDAAERVRTADTLDHERWESHRHELAALVGGPAMRGLAPRLFELLGGRPERAALRDAMLNAAPGLIQCLAATAARWMGQAAANRRAGTTADASTPAPTSVMGGQPDSCYMWRRDGLTQKYREKATETGN